MTALFLACRVLLYQFQPVPYDDAHEWGMHALEEGGPQIAVWLEQPNGSFVADVFVTAGVATFGIGNRPGNGLFDSSPRFPYGARAMALPVWAWQRGHNYPLLVMQDDNQGSYRFHNTFSTLDNFFCRPLLPSEVVDAVTCPTPFFNSDKGKFATDGSRSLYPPRHDVAASQCKLPTDSAACMMLADLDDVAAISAATPSPFAPAPYLGRFLLPDALPDGDYVVFVEVGKQFDQAAPRCPSGSDTECPPMAPRCDANSHMCARHPIVVDNMGQAAYGLGSNLGQPSVVWRVPVSVDVTTPHVATALDYAGYGDWDQPRGNLFPPDATISMTPGSGGARLAPVSDTDGTWRVKITTRACERCDMAVPPLPLGDLAATAPDGDRIDVTFSQVANAIGYEVRYVLGEQLDDTSFATATPAPPVTLGSPTHVELQVLAQRTYTIGARADGDCGTLSPLRTVTVTTPKQKFNTVDGCFIATAAFGSPLEREVRTLRAFRDRRLLGNPLGRAAVRLYYAASPPLAHAIAQSDRARAATRALLLPVVTLLR